MLSISTRKIALVLFTFMLLLGLSSCAENNSAIDIDSNGDASIKFTVPAFLDTREIDVNNLRLTVLINNAPITMIQQNLTWTGAAIVTKNSSVELMVEWNEAQADGTLLLLARAFNRQDNITTSISFSVVEDSFVSTGAEFDIDGDGISNLQERKQGLNPFMANVATNGVPADVQIFASNRTTEIDGRIGADTYWSNATYRDANDETLFINNMIRNENPATVDNTMPNYQWAAIHDEKYLTIFIFGKVPNATTALINGDSGTNFFNDDSVEIFFDGDLSRLPEGYDTVDDMLINIPLARGVGPVFEENNSSSVDKRIKRGGNVSDEVIFDVQDPALVEFATCFCGGTERSTWEIRIDIEAAQIPIGRTFGFEIQMNRDDNGGSRDSKWAWAKPARQEGETYDMSDDTWRYPIKMGKALLIPFP